MKPKSVREILNELYKRGYGDGIGGLVPAGIDFPETFDQALAEIRERVEALKVTKYQEEAHGTWNSAIDKVLEMLR